MYCRISSFSMLCRASSETDGSRIGSPVSITRVVSGVVLTEPDICMASM